MGYLLFISCNNVDYSFLLDLSSLVYWKLFIFGDIFYSVILGYDLSEIKLFEGKKLVYLSWGIDYFYSMDFFYYFFMIGSFSRLTTVSTWMTEGTYFYFDKNYFFALFDFCFSSVSNFWKLTYF